MKTATIAFHRSQKTFPPIVVVSTANKCPTAEKGKYVLSVLDIVLCEAYIELSMKK